MVDSIAYEIFYNLGLYDAFYTENMYFVCEVFAMLLVFAVILVPIFLVYYIIKLILED